MWGRWLILQGILNDLTEDSQSLMRITTTWPDVLQPGFSTSFFDRAPLPVFDPLAQGYVPANAWWMAELSRLAYRHDVEEDSAPPQPRRTSFLKRAGLRQVAFFNSEETHTQAMLVEPESAPSFAVLVFRGTEQNVKDFVTDLGTLPVPVIGGSVLVHEGFLKGLDSVWQQISRKLDEITSPLFYTGHSLGAALATLAASRRSPRAVYTFGSPRVGNDAFVSVLQSVPVYRIVDGSDMIPTLPPEVMGYSHVGEVHQLISPSPGFSFNPLAWWRCLTGPPKAFADHACINYVERIV